MGRNDRALIEVYKGVNIYQSNTIQIRVSPYKMKELIDEVEKTGLSISKIVSIGSTPCENCKGIDVVYYKNRIDKISIKRSILCGNSTQENGITILNNKKGLK